MKTLQFHYDGEVFEASVTKSKRKSLSISIEQDGTVKVRAPFSLSDATILEWVESKAGWIIRKRKEVLNNPNRREPRQFVSGETFLFLGQEYVLDVRESAARAGVVGIVDEKLVVFVKPGVSSKTGMKETGMKAETGHAQAKETSTARQKAVQHTLTTWYEKQAKIWIPRRVRYYAEGMNESFGRITLKNQKKRWGSCSSARNLNFNWRLVMAPMEILDYVVVHELCHLKQMNHSEAFWREVEKVLPDYKIRKKWLDENGNQLNLE